MKRRTFTGAALGVAGVLAARPLGGAELAAATPGPTGADPITDIGEVVHKVQVLASGIGPAPDGTPQAYYVVSGNENITAEFTVVDLRTDQNVLQVRIPYGRSSQRALGVSPVDGTVWFATSDEGHVYRHRPGTTEVEHVAALSGAERAWSMTVADDGTAWFGSYPSGSLYSVDPQTLEVANHGPALAGEQYINAIAPVGDIVYVGTQPNAKMATFDPTTGVFAELAMPDGHSGSGITAIDVRDGTMFVSTTDMHVRDLATGTWVDRITGANARVSPIDPNRPGAVYLRRNSEVTRYDIATGTLTGTGKRPNATPEAWGWVDRDGTGPYLALIYWNQGRTYGLNLATGKGFYLVPDLAGAGAPLISLGTGPEGAIYAGAFLSPPGMAKYDPDGDGSAELLPGTSQVEGSGTFDGKLVFGRYPQGSLYLYDPAAPWDYGDNPQQPLVIGDEQSRPQTLLQLDDTTVAVATVPTGGRHGGAITLWQPYAGTHQVHRHVVADQTPVGLVRHGNLLIGGTSIEGGYGIDPVTEEAVLYAWDPDSATTLWTETPVPGAVTIAGLALAGDGMVWGVADSRTVFEYDLDRRHTRRTITIDAAAPISRYGDDARLLFDHGRLFGSVADRLFVLDRVTGEVTSLYGRGSGREDGVDSVIELAQDRHADLYVIARSTHLVRYALPEDVTPPTVTARTGSADARGSAVWLEAVDDTDPNPRIHVRIDRGDWQEHPAGERIVVRPGQRLEYRAIDAAWNSTAVQRHGV